MKILRNWREQGEKIGGKRAAADNHRVEDTMSDGSTAVKIFHYSVNDIREDEFKA